MGGEQQGPAAAAAGSGLDAVLGHEAARADLRRQLAAARLSPAYWVTGPSQVGKTTLALALAEEYLGAAGWPGGLRSHPDLWLDDEEGTLRVERIRRPGQGEPEGDPEQGPNLQHFLSLSSFAGGGKVAVLARAERLSEAAANTMLRLLEEPPAGATIWLCTSRPEAIPETLRSRCQPLRLGPVGAGAVQSWLTSVRGVDGERARVAAALSQGRPGRALDLATDPQLLERTRGWLSSFLACAGAPPGTWLELSRDLAERGSDPELARSALRAWASFLRDCCCLAAGADQLARWPEQGAAAGAWAGALGLAGCARRYDLALDSLARIVGHATPRLVLDRFLLLTFGGPPPNPPA